MAPRAPLLPLLALVAACSGTGPPPPASSPALPSPPKAEPAPKAALAAPRAEEAGAPSATPAPAPPSEPLPPLTRSFVLVPLPAVEEIVSVGGRSPRDVWLFARDEVLLHHDGTRLLRRWDHPCKPRDPREVPLHFDAMVVLDGEVHLSGWTQGMRDSVNAEASLRDGSFSCSRDWYWPARFIAAAGPIGWEIYCDRSGWNCTQVSIAGPPAPLPSELEERRTPALGGLWVEPTGEAWLAGQSSGLFFYNGVAWKRIAMPTTDRVVDLWVDEHHHAWMITRPEKGPASVLRWDGGTFHALGVPPDFDAVKVRGTSARDVWFIGPRLLHAWDGERLHRGPVPITVNAAWSSLGGEIWIAGVGTAKDRGAAARLPKAGAR